MGHRPLRRGRGRRHDYLAYEHFEAVAWNGERFVAVSNFDGTIMHSTDGDRGEPAREIATFDLLRDVAWGNGRFVAVGWNGTIVISPRGSTVTP